MTDLQKYKQQLVQQFNAGDIQAFNALYEDWVRPLVYYALQLTRNNVQAEDIASEAFVKTWAKRGSFEQISGIKSYLYTVARNMCFEYLSAQKVRNAAVPAILQQQQLYDDDQLLAWQIEAELLEHIYSAVETLPSTARKVFELLYFEGLTTDKVADMLKMPVQTVRNNKTRALKLLKTEIINRKISPAWLLVFFH